MYLFTQNIADLSIALLFTANELVYYAIENYVLCYFVSNIIDDTESIGDIAYNSSWYEMSRAEPVCVEMIIRRAQRPYELKGMGVFVCSLETYLTVNETKIKQFIEMINWKYDNNLIFIWTISVDSKCYLLLHVIP